MPEEHSEIPEWRIAGDWFDLCNCAIGCPCVFGSNPTYGFCEGVLTWIIRGGNFGGVALGGDLGVVLVMHWEGNVLEKNREFGFLIDARAEAAQRDALRRIFTGKVGGVFAAWADLTIRLDGVEFVPMQVSHDAERWRVAVPGLVDGDRTANTWCPRATPAASTMPRGPKPCPATSPSARRCAIS